jgi:hypothetical protein
VKKEFIYELVLEMEHLKIETRLITEMFANVIGENILSNVRNPHFLRDPGAK